MSVYLVFFQGSFPGAPIVGTDGRQALHLPSGSIIWKGLEQEGPWVIPSPSTLLPMKQQLEQRPYAKQPVEHRSTESAHGQAGQMITDSR